MKSYQRYAFVLSLTLLAAAPLVSSAAGDIRDLKSLINAIIDVVNSLIPLLFGIALVGFIWGVIQYLFSANTIKINEARNYIIFSIIALSVMLSTWSLALLIKNSLFPNARTPFTAPPESMYFRPENSELRLTPKASDYQKLQQGQTNTNSSAPSSGSMFGDPLRLTL